MTTTTLSLMLPVRVPGDEGIKALLVNDPAKEHHRALTLAGFTASRCSDERLGQVSTMNEAIALNDQFGNRFWKTTTVSHLESETVVGDLLAHARVYLPDAAAARMVGRAQADRGSALERIGDDWVVWARVGVEVR